jgi:hypothetical protein
MSSEQEKKPSFKDSLLSFLEKPKSTGHLLRIAKQVLKNNPKFASEAGVSAWLNLPLVNLIHNKSRYLISINHNPDFEVLYITKYLPNDEAESIQILSEGLASEQKYDGEKFVEEEMGGPIFRGVSYVKGKDITGEKMRDEDKKETSWMSEYQDPITGKDALPHAQRLLKEILEEEATQTESRS